MDPITKREILMAKLTATKNQCLREGREPTGKERQWAAKILRTLGELEGKDNVANRRK